MTAAAGRSGPGVFALLLRALLVFVPLALLAHYLRWPPVAVFVLAGIGIVPLAGLMGGATENLASRFGAGVGGLLNATFGNAAELILGLVALRQGLYGVVKASLTGSIIGNTLLVLGLSIVAGGARRERQSFDRSAAGAASTLLALAAIGLVVPAVFHIIADDAVRGAALSPAREAGLEQRLSLVIAVLLFVTYLLSLLFSLRTHRHLYQGGSAEVPHGGPAGAVSQRGAVATLLVATLLVAWMSELLVGAVVATSATLHLTQIFVGVVVVAVVGNAAEHSTAVLMALRDRMDLAVHIAVGSSIQIALFAAPLLVFASYFLPHGPMDLRFTRFEVLAVLAAVAAVHMVAHDGESNWLEGVMLLAVYGMLAMAFYYVP